MSDEVSLTNPEMISSPKGKEDENETSPRVESFDKAISSYVESLFDVDNFSNVLTRSYLPFYIQDKAGFKELAKSIAEKIRTDVCQEVSIVVENMKVEQHLKELDEKLTKGTTGVFTGEPEEKIKSQIYAIKKKHLMKWKEVIDQEYDSLTKQLEEETKLFKSKKETLNSVCKEKDCEIASYKDKISQIDDILHNNTLNCEKFTALA